MEPKIQIETKYVSQGRQKFFLGSLLLSGISIRLFGDVYITEVLLSSLALVSWILGKKVFVERGLRLIPFLFISWFLANLVSSVLAGKSFSLTMIALGTPVLTGLTFRAVLEYLQSFPDQKYRVLFFFGIGRILGLVVNPLPYTSEYPWKFGYGEWVIILVLVVVAKSKSLRLLWIVAPVLAIISLLNEARTLTFLILATLAVTTFNPRKRLSVIFLLTLTLFPILSYNVYLDIALKGSLGEKESGRARLLASSDLGPLAARKEFVFSAKAFADSPLIGYGFDPQVNRQILEAGNQELVASGIRVNYAYLDKLPMHSFLMSGVVQGGVFAGLIWIFAIQRSVTGLFRSIEQPKSSRPLSVYLSLALIDRILFSPFGAIERLNFVFFLSYLLTMLYRERINP